jgi:hypothetical protein
LHNGTYSTIDVPASLGSKTMPEQINDSGVIAGSYTGPDGSFHGFIDQNGVFTTFDDPLGVGGSPGFGTFVDGINDQGVIYGTYSDASGNFFGFIATPTAVPEPGSLALLSVVGLALAARRLRKRA